MKQSYHKTEAATPFPKCYNDRHSGHHGWPAAVLNLAASVGASLSTCKAPRRPARSF
jgi:hypothetical protein